MLNTFKYSEVAKDGNWTFLVEERDLKIIDPKSKSPSVKPHIETESKSIPEGYTRDTLGEIRLGSSWLPW